MPFCPKCKAEYREGFYICHDCQEKLVDKLIPETEKKLKFVLIYEPGDHSTVAFIKSLLSANNIRFYVRNEEFRTAQDFTPIQIMVEENDLEKAKELLGDFLK